MVIADYSDVAIILLYHLDKCLPDIYFNQERDKKCCSNKKGQRSVKNFLLKSDATRRSTDITSDFWETQDKVGKATVDVFIDFYGEKIFH